ncbi:amino acid/amide ABC transporter membrane protein 1, HAAT family [Paraburkholderia fungorum]|uniref:Amino acid/amide ABC transporter membrane protein 1, HAAT family n=1 Tax=Paraburkholderia fungorum TaxID=134537 RepID=A0A1H1JLC2_9BURK|nr:branched-chain amino acid ABC transporter permease [Paraburkholderia fungorum]SDR50784.1 amino acid/amide ABC transporter membrane protein 1, HAAT family [Paraburkholderia fungorum]
MLDMLVSQAANGLVLGFVYVLIAVGLSITFGLLGVINFAHGAFFALGAYVAYQLYQMFGWPAVVLAPILVGIIGMVVEVVIIRRLYGREPLSSLIVTFALALLIEALIRFFWGADGKPFNQPEFLSGIVEAGPLLITKYRVAVLVATVGTLVALGAFLAWTPYGRILRAGSRDPEMVELLGINLPRVLTGVFGLGCALAAIAGVLAAPLWTVSPSMAANAIMPAFVVVAIGGLGSFAGAVVAGLAVGVVSSLTIQFQPDAAAASMYALMFLVMLLRPRGLFGEHWERFE